MHSGIIMCYFVLLLICNAGLGRLFAWRSSLSLALWCWRAATNSTSGVWVWAARAGLSRDKTIGLAVGLVSGCGVVLLAALIACTVMRHRRYAVSSGSSFKHKGEMPRMRMQVLVMPYSPGVHACRWYGVQCLTSLFERLRTEAGGCGGRQRQGLPQDGGVQGAGGAAVPPAVPAPGVLPREAHDSI